jgi:Uma2 family endonuclease
MATVTTKTDTPPAPDAAEARTFPPHRLTVERYERMVAAGIFSAKEPIFLWKGRLVEKMTKGPDHVNAQVELLTLLFRLVLAEWHVRQEQPVALGDGSVPEPDVSVIRGGRRDYLSRHPGPGDVTLIVEVADSSLPMDAGEVLETYAANAIPIYWIVNIPRRRIEVYTEPSGPAESPTYRASRFYLLGEEAPVVLDGREVGRVAVDAILP